MSERDLFIAALKITEPAERTALLRTRDPEAIRVTCILAANQAVAVSLALVH